MLEEKDEVTVDWPAATDFHEKTGKVAEKRDLGGYGYMYLVQFPGGERRQFARHHLRKVDQGSLFPESETTDG